MAARIGDRKEGYLRDESLLTSETTACGQCGAYRSIEVGLG